MQDLVVTFSIMISTWARDLHTPALLHSDAWKNMCLFKTAIIICSIAMLSGCGTITLSPSEISAINRNSAICKIQEVSQWHSGGWRGITPKELTADETGWDIVKTTGILGKETFYYSGITEKVTTFSGRKKRLLYKDIDKIVYYSANMFDFICFCLCPLINPMEKIKGAIVMKNGFRDEIVFNYNEWNVFFPSGLFHPSAPLNRAKEYLNAFEYMRIQTQSNPNNSSSYHLR